MCCAPSPHPATSGPDARWGNGGAAQRSVIDTLTVSFASPITVEAAIQLLWLQRRGDTGFVRLDISQFSVSGNVVTIAFRSVGLDLADGVYDLKLAQELMVIPAPATQTVATFHRLFGDADGDKDVDSLDWSYFKAAYGKTSGQAGYQWYFDYDGNGTVDANDYSQFRLRLGKRLLA